MIIALVPEHLRARLELLRAEQAQEKQQYAALEQRLLALQRNMDMRYGGMQELEELLAALPMPAEPTDTIHHEGG